MFDHLSSFPCDIPLSVHLNLSYLPLCPTAVHELSTERQFSQLGIAWEKEKKNKRLWVIPLLLAKDEDEGTDSSFQDQK